MRGRSVAARNAQAVAVVIVLAARDRVVVAARDALAVTVALMVADELAAGLQVDVVQVVIECAGIARPGQRLAPRAGAAGIGTGRERVAVHGSSSRGSEATVARPP